MGNDAKNHGMKWEVERENTGKNMGKHTKDGIQMRETIGSRWQVFLNFNALTCWDKFASNGLCGPENIRTITQSGSLGVSLNGGTHKWIVYIGKP